MVQRTANAVDSIPAPVGGWNVRDSLASMEITDAVELENLFPTVSNVVLRGGYKKHATGLPSTVDTLMSYAGGATEKLFAASSTSFYDVTTAGAVGSPVVTGLTNAIWEYTNVATPGGAFLMAVNGIDSARLYNGSTWSIPAITGVSSANLSNIALFKNRLWFIEKNTLKAWYLPTLSIGGAAEYIDLSSVAKYGGHLVDLDTWTIDAGYGVDDNLVFITSTGEVIVYRGTDPASAATWALAGIWKLGSPIGARCMLKWAGDLLILTYDGLLPLAQSLQSSRLDPRVALSNKIQGAITEATTLYGGDHAAVGWQITYTAKNNAVWINVPVGQGQQVQYVMNTITTSWCKFSGWAANCWEIFGDDPYFGGSGFVGRAWTTGPDGYSDDNANISTNCIQAFNYFGSRGVKKYFTRARPSIFSNGQPSIAMNMNIDFALTDVSSALSFSPNPAATWDVSLWDTGLWGSDSSITNNWQGITGIGYCGGIHLKSSSQYLSMEWASTDIVYQAGWAGI
jgi:hypothetical protein